MASWPGRLAAGIGVLVAALQSCPGFSYYFGGDAPVYITDFSGTWAAFTGIWPAVEWAVILGAALGGIGTALRYRAALLTRVTVTLGVISLLTTTMEFNVYPRLALTGSPSYFLPAITGLTGVTPFTASPLMLVVLVLAAGAGIAGAARVALIAVQVLRVRTGIAYR
jgi:hypothetical protein